MSELPNPGGDLTNIAQSAPGVIMNNTAGYGNFTMNGLPATSNLFTVNGENDMDPYFNINARMRIGGKLIRRSRGTTACFSGCQAAPGRPRKRRGRRLAGHIAGAGNGRMVFEDALVICRHRLEGPGVRPGLGCSAFEL